MNTIFYLFSYISFLVFLTGLFLFPIGDLRVHADPDESEVVTEDEEVTIPNELDEILSSLNLEYIEDNEGETKSIYEIFSDICATMLLSINNVIAMNQELINRDPKTGNYFFKGAAPPVISGSVANDVSLRTGTKLKLTALRLRNPRNKPDLWEEKALRTLEKDVTKEGVGELTKLKGKSVYRYMKPLYMEMECLMCHTYPEAMPPMIREYIRKNYPTDKSMGYKTGELRGGISVIISPTEEGNAYEHFADISATMLLSIRNVIAKNQELINRDPETGNYYFKGAVPAIVGRSIANDFGLMTGIELKQTALRVRNPLNKPDEWEEKALKEFEKNKTEKGFGELTEVDGESVYRYMKPLFMEMQCLMCHSHSEAMPPEVREFIERNYSTDESLGYKAGELRGGISVLIPIQDEFAFEFLSKE
ncbi:MAG: DUF3365 domain-containing protein [Candidatus Scalindua sp.]|nr:DUF3365 domain-containing protein [Candidatus Scalindua sp.]